MKLGTLIGLGLGGALTYALTRKSSPTSAPVAQHAPSPDSPEDLTAPSPSTPATPMIVMVGFNVGWPDNIVATESYMEQNVPPAVTATISKVNDVATGGSFLPGARTMIKSTPYGYLATVLVQWQGAQPVDKTWLRSTIVQLIQQRGGQVASHLRDVQVA